MYSHVLSNGGIEGSLLPKCLELDKLCDQFESEVRAGRKPLIEDYLARVPAELQSMAFVELLGVELEVFVCDGKSPSLDDHRRRFPQFAELLEAEWEKVERTSLGTKSQPGSEPTVSVGTARPAANPAGILVPEQLGRYRIERLLGEGGFGRVYRAYDTRLDRTVAIKIPYRSEFRNSADIEACMEEARTAARLHHSGIVAVFDVQLEDGFPYIVQQFIDGSDLGHWMRAEAGRSHIEIVEILVRVTEAVAFLHAHQLVHRDLKPSNILIDSANHPFVADFGLAIHQATQSGRAGEVAGTWFYMSPEQLRGETHNLDGRSDLWSIGVIFFELLTGRKPFTAATRLELVDQLRTGPAHAPRMLVPNTPQELERICLKCLQVRRADRYPSATELGDDLNHWLVTTKPLPDRSRVATELDAAVDRSSSSRPVTPKGLGTFDERDSEFFLDMVPGPRDRQGLPESVRFWKSKLEDRDADRTFRVALLYGPSGSGKSSLMKAGVIPVLSDQVITLNISATANDSAIELLHEIRKRLPQLSKSLNIVETLQWVRERGAGSGRKLALIIDQSEQWLQARRANSEDPLVDALRHCDGSHLQCVMIVRDEFWMAATQLMRDLEVPLVEGQTSVAIDLLPLPHAEKVLAAFGRAYQALPPEPHQPTPEQSEFLRRATAELAEDAKVNCARLALFSDVVRTKDWHPHTLEQLGGMSAVGFVFLEETLGSTRAPPHHRYHAQAARSVLLALLPKPGDGIRKTKLSYSTLQEASGYTSRRDFEELLHLLESELRLIAPTEFADRTQAGEGSAANTPRSVAEDAPTDTRYYQLTHDYLVPSLRDWLTSKQRETARGRAELCLADRTDSWNIAQDPRYLPSLLEYLSIVLVTDRRLWTDPQRRMMRVARRRYLSWVAGSFCALALMISAGWLVRDTIRHDREQIQQQTKIQGLVDSLKTATIIEVPAILVQLEHFAPRHIPAMQRKLDEAAQDPNAQLNLALGLLPSDSSQLEFLYDCFMRVAPEKISIIRQALWPHRGRLLDRLWEVVSTEGPDPQQQRLRAAAALAAYDPVNAHWKDVTQKVVDELVTVSSVHFKDWLTMLQPIRTELVPPLLAVLRDSNRREADRNLATESFAQFAEDQPDLLASAIADSTETQFSILYPALAKNSPASIRCLKSLVDTKLDPAWSLSTGSLSTGSLSTGSLSPGNTEWKRPNETVGRHVEESMGMVQDDFAFVQSLPVEQLSVVDQDLKKGGYRLNKLRPYASVKLASGLPVDPSVPAQVVLVAALWTRDGRDSRFVCDQSKDELKKLNQDYSSEFIPTDVAGYTVSSDTGPHERFAATWSRKTKDTDNAKVFLAYDYRSMPNEAKLLKDGYQCSSTQHFLDGHGHYAINSVYRTNVPASEVNRIRDVYQTAHLAAQARLAVDISVTGPFGAPLVSGYFQRDLDASLKTLEVAPQDPGATRRLGRARFGLYDDSGAIISLGEVLRADPKDEESMYYRSIAFARQGNHQGAKEEFEQFLVHDPHPTLNHSLLAILAAYRGDLSDVHNIRKSLIGHENNWTRLYRVACGYGGAAEAVLGTPECDEFTRLSLDYLRRAVRAGLPIAAVPWIEKDFRHVRQTEEFYEILADGELDRFSSLVSIDSATHEAHLISARPLREALQQAKTMLAQHYRPVAVSTTHLWPEKSYGSVVSSIVLHRPRFKPSERYSLAVRRAGAVIALLRQGERDKIRDVLRVIHDPEPLTQFIHRCRARGIDPRDLWEMLLDSESRRRSLGQEQKRIEEHISYGLLLSLGEFPWQELHRDLRQTAVQRLRDWYEHDPSSCIHSATGWLLRKWNQEEFVRQVDQTEIPYQLGREWFTLKFNAKGTTFYQTYIVIPPGEHQIGAPLDEAGRTPPRSFT